MLSQNALPTLCNGGFFASRYNRTYWGYVAHTHAPHKCPICSIKRIDFFLIISLTLNHYVL